MSDTVNRKALDSIKLLVWMYENGYFSLIAADMIADEVEKGTFDIMVAETFEKDALIESLKKENERLKEEARSFAAHNRDLHL